MFYVGNGWNLPKPVQEKSHFTPKEKKMLKENVIHLGCDFIFRIIKHIYPTVLHNRPGIVFLFEWFLLL